MSRFVQYPPRPLSCEQHQPDLLAGAPLPRIAIVTPSYNQRRYLEATIDSVLAQGYPALSYRVQDAASTDGSAALLQSYADRLDWRSEADDGQADAINKAFALSGDCDIMAYLNSDDTLLPGTLAYVAGVFQTRPDIDIVYGHRIFINANGLEIGRAVFPPHDSTALKYIGFVPQETMFWRRRVWDKTGPFDTTLRFALDWDFMLRAEAAGFTMVRLPRFLGCFRIHDEQKTSAMMDVGRDEMNTLRKRYLGRLPTHAESYRAVAPFLIRQYAFHWLHRAGLLKS